MKIAICDDCLDQINTIKKSAECYAVKYIEQSIQISEYDNSLLFLEELKHNGGFDILLLDICMPGILGTDVAREIRSRKDKTEIIFVTTSDEFAVEAFALKAAHYLIKPFVQTQFDEAMNRAMERFAASQVKKITLRLPGSSIQIIDVNDIIFIESFSHAQNIHLKNGECIEVRLSMSQLMSELEEASKKQFISPYKGYIVNQQSIRTIGSDGIILRNGKRLPIVKRSFREIQERYFNYMFGGDRL